MQKVHKLQSHSLKSAVHPLNQQQQQKNLIKNIKSSNSSNKNNSRSNNHRNSSKNSSNSSSRRNKKWNEIVGNDRDAKVTGLAVAWNNSWGVNSWGSATLNNWKSHGNMSKVSFRNRINAKKRMKKKSLEAPVI